MRLWKKKSHIGNRGQHLTPDEIFIDASNVSGFSREQLEGVIERPLSRGVFYVLGGMLFVVGLLFIGRSFWLQYARGDEFSSRAEKNFIEIAYVEPPRGVIYDRYGEAIVFNEAVPTAHGSFAYQRVARHPQAFSHLIGFIGELSEEDIAEGKDVPGIELVGKDGLEEAYDHMLRGIPGTVHQEQDVSGNVLAEGVIEKATEGDDVHTTIDGALQIQLYTLLDETIRDRGFRGGGGVIFSLETGEIYSLVSLPSYDIHAFTDGLSNEEADAFFSDSRAPLFNRVVSGTYAPGSIVKPFLAYAALVEGIISPQKEIYSSGRISIPNPYNPDLKSIFLDWKAHGYVNMARAIAVSSNVYFYAIGGGYEGIEGLGVERIQRWFEFFQFNTKTGIDLAGESEGLVPSPEWKETAHPDNPIWRIGDTYHVSIGQGDLLVTPLEIARGLGMLATKGDILPFHVVPGGNTRIEHINLDETKLSIIEEGMKGSANVGGTAQAVASLPFDIAAKTGTAEVGNDTVHSWYMGYTPVEDSKLGMVIFMERGPRANLIGATSVALGVYQWMQIERPELLGITAENS